MRSLSSRMPTILASRIERMGADVAVSRIDDVRKGDPAHGDDAKAHGGGPGRRIQREAAPGEDYHPDEASDEAGRACALVQLLDGVEIGHAARDELGVVVVHGRLRKPSTNQIWAAKPIAIEAANKISPKDCPAANLR